MPNSMYDRRLARCRAAMRERELDALILTPGAAMRYLTGFSEPAFERLLCVIVTDAHPPLFITPALNAEQARANPAGISDIRAWTDSEGWEQAFRNVAGELGLGRARVGVDEYMPARFLLPAFDTISAERVAGAGPVFADLRSVKDADELAIMQRAANLTDRAYHAAAGACRPGITEAELARVVSDTIHEGGGELAFDTIVGSGPNSALPHHGAGNRRVEEGEIVLFDLGARVDYYCGDITRVVSMGPPASDASAIYDIVFKAHTDAVEAVRPSAPASAIDSVARASIESAGYGELFFHRTGHGIGLDDHEAPNIVQGNDARLQPGNCFSVEPGIYIAGRFGIRLENIVTVTETGFRVLNEPIPSRLTDVSELR
jgi:Xaa-Pro aminopeptidase